MTAPDGLSFARDARASMGVLGRFLVQGCIGFGGPTAHIARFEREFVTRRNWVDHRGFASLVGLATALPGPSSSQVAFALGFQRAGIPGALAASVGFTLPSMLVMVAAVLGLSMLGDARTSGWMQGLHAGATGVVLVAIISMARIHATSAGRATIAVLAAVAMLRIDGPWLLPAVVGCSALLGLLLAPDARPDPDQIALRVPSRGTSIAGVVGAIALLVLALVASPGEPSGARLVAALIQSGSLVVGGGHVVLPMLERSVVDAGLLDQSLFAGGYAIAQAVPGPLFSIGSFLGAVHGLPHGTAALIGWTIAATVAIMGPGLLIMLAALRSWHRLSSWTHGARAFAGVAAAVTGLLAAAWIDPMALSLAWRSPVAVPCVLLVIVAPHVRVPAPAAIALCAAWGWLLGP